MLHNIPLKQRHNKRNGPFSSYLLTFYFRALQECPPPIVCRATQSSVARVRRTEWHSGTFDRHSSPFDQVKRVCGMQPQNKKVFQGEAEVIIERGFEKQQKSNTDRIASSRDSSQKIPGGIIVTLLPRSAFGKRWTEIGRHLCCDIKGIQFRRW